MNVIDLVQISWLHQLLQMQWNSFRRCINTNKCFCWTILRASLDILNTMCRYTKCYDICRNLEPIDEVWSYCSMRSAYHWHEELACTKKNQSELTSHEQHVAVTLYWKFIVNRRKYAIYIWVLWNLAPLIRHIIKILVKRIDINNQETDVIC